MQARHLPINMVSERRASRARVRRHRAFVVAAEDRWRNPRLAADRPGARPDAARMRVGLVVESITGAPVDGRRVPRSSATAHLLGSAGHDVEPIELPSARSSPTTSCSTGRCSPTCARHDRQAHVRPVVDRAQARRADRRSAAHHRAHAAPRRSVRCAGSDARSAAARRCSPARAVLVAGARARRRRGWLRADVGRRAVAAAARWLVHAAQPHRRHPGMSLPQIDRRRRRRRAAVCRLRRRAHAAGAPRCAEAAAPFARSDEPTGFASPRPSQRNPSSAWRTGPVDPLVRVRAPRRTSARVSGSRRPV